VLHVLAKAPPRSVEPHVEVRRRDAERAGDIADVLARHVDAPDHLGVRRPLLGEQAEAAATRPGDGWFLGCHVGHVHPGARTVRGAGAMVIHDRVPQDAIEPGTRARPIVDGRRTLGRPEKRALHDIVCVGLRPDTLARKTHEAHALAR
jgi:hypothetical protein